MTTLRRCGAFGVRFGVPRLRGSDWPYPPEGGTPNEGGTPTEETSRVTVERGHVSDIYQAGGHEATNSRHTAGFGRVCSGDLILNHKWHESSSAASARLSSPKSGRNQNLLAPRRRERQEDRTAMLLPFALLASSRENKIWTGSSANQVVQRRHPSISRREMV